jgi:LPS-assembly protein
MRKLILIALLSIVAVAEGKLEMMAEDLSATKDTIRAEGDVVVHYQNTIIEAPKASYDREKEVLTLKSDDSSSSVEMMGYQGSKIVSSEVSIDTKTKETHFKNTFLSDSSDIWIFANSAIKRDENLTFGASMMSSCDMNSSDWTLYSKSSEYDGKEHYMKMRNVKMKLWDIPVVYTPYLAFSTNAQRRSGVLFPAFGYSDNEGFIYEQPLYWAISKSMDIEINPQIRTNRGEGIYGTLRFADSPYSSGGIRMGYFRDQDNYVAEHELENKNHYGLEMLYSSSNVIERIVDRDVDISDGVYIDLALLNDIDYIYLQKKPMNHFGVSLFVESKVNYFANNDDYFGGVYAKYFIDTTVDDNNNTMQILPTIQLHKYLKTIFSDHLTYSMDLTTNNYTREEGTTLKLLEFYTPIEYTTTIFDDFVSLSFKEDLYYKKALYGNATFENDDYEYYNAVHRAKIFTDLTKKYSSFVHVLQPSLTYSLPSNDDGLSEEFDELEDEQKKLYSPGFEEEDISFRLSQYFYDDGGNLKFYQRLSQSYLPQQDEYNWGDLSNEMQYNVANWKFYNLLIYSHQFSKIKEMSSRIDWGGRGYGIALSHSYERIYSWGEGEEIKTYKKTNDIKLDIGYQITHSLTLNAGFTYDIDNENSEDELQYQYRVGFKYDRGCWNLALGMKQEIKPMQTTNGSKSIEENIFGFQLNFVPFGGIKMSTEDEQRY